MGHGALLLYYIPRPSKDVNDLVLDTILWCQYLFDNVELDCVLCEAKLSANLAFAQMGPAFNETAKSFRITPPTEEYVPPYKDPWRFW